MSKRNILSFPVLLAYCIPFAFLAMYADMVWNTSWLYLPSVLLPAGLGWFCGKTGRLFPGIAGNLLSAVSSVLFLFAFGTEQWSYYFKPFGPLGLLFLIWIFTLVPQTLLWRRYQKSTLTYALVFTSVLLLLTSFSLSQLFAMLWPY